MENLDLSDTACLKLSVSKGIGLGIVVGGSIVKVPQVLLSTCQDPTQLHTTAHFILLCAVLSSGSVRGLSLPAFTLETLGYAFSLAYSARNGFPFSTCTFGAVQYFLLVFSCSQPSRRRKPILDSSKHCRHAPYSISFSHHIRGEEYVWRTGRFRIGRSCFGLTPHSSSWFTPSAPIIYSSDLSILENTTNRI